MPGAPEQLRSTQRRRTADGVPIPSPDLIPDPDPDSDPD